MNTDTHTIRLHRVLRAKPERVYRAFLDADAKAKWLPPHGFTGKVHHLATNAIAVSEVLTQLRVVLRSQDKLSIAKTAAVKDGMVIRITRLDGRNVGEDIAIPFAVERRADSSMFQGQTKVLRSGRVGGS
jgi:hypothetical protein